MKNLTTILVIAIIFSVISGCSSGTKTEETKPKTDDTKPKVESTQSPTKSDTNSTTSGAIEGSYSVNGSGLDGKNYQGSMSVKKQGSVYQLSWDVAGSKYDGVGVTQGNTMAVAYSTGADGKGCGAVIYKINSDDSLDGIWGEWGINQSGVEKAKPIGQTKQGIGVFDIEGTNGNGSAYKGKLAIKRNSEDVYTFGWEAGNTKYFGTGVKMGDYLAAGSGAKQCGFVIYEIGNGKLSGKWGVPGTTQLGTETATRN